MTLHAYASRALACLLALVAIASALPAHAGDSVDVTRLPIVDGPPETRSTPFLAWYRDLAEVGYVEEEYLVSGTANVYEYVDDANQSAAVRVQSANLPYTTRILVRRPIAPKRFNGTVLVDVLNATAGWDGDAIWYGNYEYITRSGIVWVGISTKPVTVNFLRDRWGRPPFPVRNASRYATLSMPAFGQVWDMLSQIGALLKTPGSAANPLRDLHVRRSILVGYSQSAAYQVTYANSFHERSRLHGGRPVFDAYFIAAGGASAKHVTGATAATENLPRGDARNLVRVAAPVVKLQTQTEVVNFPSYPVRQTEPDHPWVRTYEIAGGSHVDAWRDVEGGQALTRDLGLPPSFCAAPAVPKNPLKTSLYESAALHNLAGWLAGRRPPPSRLMQLDPLPAGGFALARDPDGNVIGGVRPPELRAPIGKYLESNTGPGFCGLYGGFDPYSAARLQELYPRRGAFTRQFVHGVIDAVDERYLLPADGIALALQVLANPPL